MITDEEIFDIIDGLANEELLAKHYELIGVSQEYRIKFEEFEKMETVFSSLKLESPSNEFTKNLMGKLTVSKSPAYSKKMLKIPFYFLGFLIFLVTIVIVLAIKFSYDINSNYDFSLGIKPNNILLFKQISLIINGLVFLLILDKWIFKKYFQSRLS